MALLRPGYSDEGGAKSPGNRGLTVGDNYMPEIVATIHSAVLAARTRYHAADLTLVGHSGGAAIAAAIAEEDPNLVSRLLLVSCPCDLPAWRWHMASQQLNPLWLLPVHSVSPLGGARTLSPRLRLRVVVGQNDDVTPPWLSQAFVGAAKAAGLRQATTAVLPNAGHNVLLDPRVLEELVTLSVGP